MYYYNSITVVQLNSSLLLNNQWLFLVFESIVLVDQLFDFVGNEEKKREEQEWDAQIAQVEGQPVVHRFVEVSADTDEDESSNGCADQQIFNHLNAITNKIINKMSD